MKSNLQNQKSSPVGRATNQVTSWFRKSFGSMAMILLLCMALSFIPDASGANLICVTSGSTTTLFTHLDSAVLAAPAGATIYLSGGSFSLDQNITISSQLNFVGAGYWPDSTGVTNRTVILNGGNGSTITFHDGADLSTFTGIDFSFSTFNTANQSSTFTNITFSRCIFNLTNHFDATNQLSNGNIAENVFTFSECVMNTQIVSNGNGDGHPIPCIFDRCLFYVSPNTVGNSTYTHCSFVENSPSSVDLGVNSSFSNCAFLACNLANWGNAPHPSFTNCITSEGAFPSGSIVTNCIFSVSPSAFYTTIVGTTFLFTNNYQLSPSSPGHNFSIDGTDVGIYGTAFPFKAGAVPYNPHFISGSVSPSTDVNGNLIINLNIGAQTR